MELDNNMGETCIKDLIQNIRSVDDDKRKLTISQIPSLILRSIESKDDILNQLLLVIYNLNTLTENYETLNASNRGVVIRFLLRLYSETIRDHHHLQIDSLVKIVDMVHSSEILVELAYVLHRCTVNSDLDKNQLDIVEEALGAIHEKAVAHIYPEVLLMIHSIKAIKY